MFYENLQAACKMKGTSPTALVKKLGISTGNVTYWKKNTPNGDIIIQISELLDISCDYLLKGKENIVQSGSKNTVIGASSSNITINNSGADLTPQEKDLLTVFKGLDVANQSRLIVYAHDLKLKN